MNRDYSIFMDCDISVGYGKTRKVEFPHVARAGPINPCVVIGIYDALSKSGYISKNYAGSQQLLDETIKKTIDLALDNSSDRTKLKIVIAGANKSDKIIGREKRLINRLSRDTWKDISSIVSGYGFEEGQIEFYNNKTSLAFDMYLDCKNGQIVVEEAKDITSYLNKAK
jgi:hypothetical protein